MSRSRPVLKGPPPGTKPVDPLHAFPTASLWPYLATNVAGFADAVKASGRPAEVATQIFQFAHGQSNPTFTLQITREDGSVVRRYVLRKKPKGKLLPSAHAIDREYRIMTALRGSSVPVPMTYCLCSEPSVIGESFFVMDYLTGRIFKDITLPGLDRKQRFAMYADMARVLANLHRLDPVSLGLGDFGPRDGKYLSRQVKRWSAQYQAAKVDELPLMDDLIRKLEGALPSIAKEESERTSIIHGDYRLDNLMFHPTEPRVIGVLDWELATLGHPISDLAYNSMVWHIPSGASATMPGLAGLPLRLKGIPSERVYKRSLQGNASQSDSSATFRTVVPLIVQKALDVLEGSDASSASSDSQADALAQTSIRATLGCFNLRPQFWELHQKLTAFMDDYIYPNEATFFAQHAALKASKGSPWHVPPIMEELKAKAKAAGLWNLFFTVNKNHKHSLGVGLTNVEYAPLCEIMGRAVHMAPEVFNCSAPDTGNMEVLANYGTEAQKERWLKPLMNGEIRSCFGMTEPFVASSDATNIECSIQRDGDEYLINGRKWWTSGAMDPRCSVCILMGQTDPSKPKHQAQSMILVEMDRAGVEIVRPLHVFGYDDAPHGHAEVVFKNVRVPASNILLGEGRGFEIAQGRLGPGRIHHCMRLIGMAERALEELLTRTLTRTAFGGLLATKGAMLKDIADSRIEIDSCRLLCMQAASMMDTVGNKLAAQQIGMIKVMAPNMALRVLDRAIQAQGARGVCQDTTLPWMWAGARTLRLADGPDEVHRENIAKLELLKAKL